MDYRVHRGTDLAVDYWIVYLWPVRLLLLLGIFYMINLNMVKMDKKGEVLKNMTGIGKSILDLAFRVEGENDGEVVYLLFGPI